MSYVIKEIFYTLQGEGAHAGRPSVFCRFAGCNLWSGREDNRAGATCPFCDTDFVGTNGTNGGKYPSAESVAVTIKGLWPVDCDQQFVVCTGGEPLLQLDQPLIDALHQHGFFIAIETNGTLSAPHGVDWICVSPKAGAEWTLRSGHELKVVFPQDGLNPLDYAHLDFQRFSVQPMDGVDREKNTQAAIAFCLQNPQWRLSLQTHKMTGIR